MEEKNYMTVENDLLADVLAEAMAKNPNGKDLAKIKELLPQGYFESQQKVKQKQPTETIEVDDFNNYDFNNRKWKKPNGKIILPLKNKVY